MSSRRDNTTVLVVDDDKDIADLYQLQLQNRYNAKAVYGGEEALEIIDETVDVALLDRRMPELSGDDVLQEIRDRGVGCRVVMVSAVYKDSGESIPADDYYEKPLGQESLYEAVESQLDARNGSHNPD